MRRDQGTDCGHASPLGPTGKFIRCRARGARKRLCRRSTRIDLRAKLAPIAAAAAALGVVNQRRGCGGCRLSASLNDVSQALAMQVDAQSLQRQFADLAPIAFKLSSRMR